MVRTVTGIVGQGAPAPAPHVAGAVTDVVHVAPSQIAVGGGPGAGASAPLTVDPGAPSALLAGGDGADGATAVAGAPTAAVPLAIAIIGTGPGPPRLW